MKKIRKSKKKLKRLKRKRKSFKYRQKLMDHRLKRRRDKIDFEKLTNETDNLVD